MVLQMQLGLCAAQGALCCCLDALQAVGCQMIWRLASPCACCLRPEMFLGKVLPLAEHVQHFESALTHAGVSDMMSYCLQAPAPSVL